MIGAISLFLPWVGFTVTNGTASAYSGENAVQLLGNVVSQYRPSTVTDPALLAWQHAAASGTGMWILGSVVFAMGCALLVGQAFSSIRWAGLWLVLGVYLSGLGITSFPTPISDQGYTVYVGLSFGYFLAVFATIIGMVPLFLRNPDDEWVPPWDPRLEMGVGPLNAQRVDPNPSPGAAEPAPLEDPVPWAPEPRRFCPECGRWYLGGETECERDRTPLKAIPSPDAPPGA